MIKVGELLKKKVVSQAFVTHILLSYSNLLIASYLCIL